MSIRVDLQEEEEIGVQMAPLIDCVFLLIIFFLVATTMRKIEKELPLDFPVAAASVSRQVEADMTIISIDREGTLYLGSEPVGQGFLLDHLRELAARDSDHRIRIDADRYAPMWAGVQVLDICHFEGLTNIGVRTKEESFDPHLP